MIIDSDTYVGNRLSSIPKASVRTITMDAIHRELGLARIHFLKMKIKGAERLAIRGMRETLRETEIFTIFVLLPGETGTGDESLRTKNEVKHFLQENGIKVLKRADGKPYIRDQVLGVSTISS